MSKLVAPHGGKGLVCCKLHGNELEAEMEKAAGLKKIQISPRAKGDLIINSVVRSLRSTRRRRGASHVACDKTAGEGQTTAHALSTIES